MRSVATDIREEQIRETLALSPEERVRLLMRLSEEALRFFMSARGLTREEAVAEIRRTRRAGRQRSACMDDDR